jgi:hypothetical protein
MSPSVICVTLLTAMTSLSSMGSELKLGDQLPELRGEYLSGKKAILPKDASGRTALLLLGYTYQSRFAVEAWTKRFREDFGKNPQVTFYEIPMIGGMARLGKWFIDSGMRRGTAKADYENVITVYGGIDPWKQRLAVTDETFAYLILIDPSGKVVWRHAGPFDQERYGQFAAKLRAMLPER